MKTRLSFLLMAAGSVGLCLPAGAEELQVVGSGTVNVKSGAPADVRERATMAAKARAVAIAVDRVLGPDASLDPKVAPKLDQVVAQVPASAIIDTRAARVGDNYQVTVTLVLDQKQFRELLSDFGIALNTSTARAQGILAVMDEFLTTPRDIRAPVEELEEFHHEAGGSYQDTSKMASSDKSSAQGGSSFHGHGEGVSVGAVDSLSAHSASSSSAKMNVSASEHDNTSYKKLVRYQPQGVTPEKVSQTYNALIGELQDFDLRVIDNDVFRSKYFKDHPVTIDQLENSEQLSRYVGFARSDANADFFMVGTSVIIDSGTNPSTGERNCSGVVTVKTYSTLTGESIASETASEVAAGGDLNDCAGNVAKKLARVAGASIGRRVQDYWKRRNAYGREYMVTLLTKASLPLMVRMAFIHAIKATPGVESSTSRVSTDRQVQLVVTYKGTDSLDQAVATGLASNPAFSSLDARMEGTTVTFCMGPCSAIGN